MSLRYGVLGLAGEPARHIGEAQTVPSTGPAE